MKTMNKMGLGCLALALCLPAMYSTQSLAQDTSGPPPAQQPDGAGQQGGRPSMEQMRERQLERMTKELNLTPDQVTQVRAIDKDGMVFSATPSGAWLPSVIAGDSSSTR